MRNVVKAIGFIGLVMLLFTGCGVATVYNVNKNPVISDKSLSQKQMFKAIYAAGSTLGWQIKDVKPGLAVGHLYLRKHVAIVEIPYNEKEFSIIYKNSTNLNYNSEKGTIHSNYNGWIQNLEKAINVQVKLQSM